MKQSEMIRAIAHAEVEALKAVIHKHNLPLVETLALFAEVYNKELENYESTTTD